MERGLKNKEYIKIGVNKYVDEEEHDVELHEYDPTTQEKQIANLKQVKAERSDSEVSRTLKETRIRGPCEEECHARAGGLL